MREEVTVLYNVRHVGFVDPRIELVGITSPLDEVFRSGGPSTSSRANDFFYLVQVIGFGDALKLSVVERSFHRFAVVIDDFVRGRIGSDGFVHGEYLLGPIRQVAFVESSTSFAYSHFLADFEFGFDRTLSRLVSVHSFVNLGGVFDIHVDRRSADRSVMSAIVRMDHVLQNVDELESVAMREVFPHLGFQRAIESFDDAGFNVLVLTDVKLYVPFFEHSSELSVDELFALVRLQLERFSFFFLENFGERCDDALGIFLFQRGDEGVFGKDVDDGQQISKAVVVLGEVGHVCQIGLPKIVDAARKYSPACETTPDGFVQTVRLLFCQPVGSLLLSNSLSFGSHQAAKCIHAAVTSRLSNAVIIFHHR